jgi:hypothetical protein
LFLFPHERQDMRHDGVTIACEQPWRPFMANPSRTLPWPRRLIVDLLHFSRRVPSIPVERIFKIGKLVEIRSSLVERPGWTALFVKAFGILAHETPALRTSYLGYPWERLVEHDTNVASIAIEKDIDGQSAVLFAKIRGPENRSALHIEQLISVAKSCPVRESATFRLAHGISKLPTFIRRMIWWLVLEWSGSWRARKFGTFGISSYGMLGAESLHPLSPLTATLTFGPISPKGKVRVRIIYDHRVCDGSVVARALARLEQILNEDLSAELRDLGAGRELEATTEEAPTSTIRDKKAS